MMDTIRLSSKEHLSILIISKFYSRLWPIPLVWGFDCNALRQNKTKHISVASNGVAFMVLFVTICGLNTLVYPYILPTHPFGRADVIIIDSLCIGICGIYSGIYMGTEKYKIEIIGSFNALCRLEQRVTAGILVL